MRKKSARRQHNLQYFFGLICLVLSIANIYNYYSESFNTRIPMVKTDLYQQIQINNFQRRLILRENYVGGPNVTDLDLASYRMLYEKKRFIERRVNMGRPKRDEPQLLIWKFTTYKSNSPQSQTHKSSRPICTFINAINMLTPSTLYSAVSMLASNQNPESQVYILARKEYGYNRLYLYHILRTMRYRIERFPVTIDSDYRFIQKFVGGCQKLVYFFGNTVVDRKMGGLIRSEAMGLDHYQCMFTSRFIQDQYLVDLPDLADTDLQQLHPKQFYKYVYILDPKFYSIITPFNFAYYNKYTIQQILLIPILTIVQKSNFLLSTKKKVHSIKAMTTQFVQFKMKQPQKQLNALCFINYPNDAQRPKKQDFSKYYQNIITQQRQKLNISLVVYLPYKFQNKFSLAEFTSIIMQNQENEIFKLKRVRVRIVANKTSAAHAMYQSCYMFCPNKAMIVSSRYNALFTPPFSQKIIKNADQKYHYYHTYIRSDYENITQMLQVPPYNEQTKPRNSDIFLEQFSHFQIFKSDLLKTSIFHVSKSAQVDFYETQAPFVVLMLEEVHLRVKIIKDILVHVQKRQMSIVEQNQIKYVKSYAEYWELVYNQLNPYEQNCLQNQQYRRFAPQKIPRKIHQVWIADKQISPIRKKLRQTIIKANPDFNVTLHTKNHITKQHLPITYNLIRRTMQYNKDSNTSYMSLVADLMRYEIVYHNGGIYIDFKMEGKKPLNSFLKNQIFFIDCDISSLRFNRPQVIGNGIMGAAKNSQYLSILLREIILQENLNYQVGVQFMTGSFMARKSFNDEQFFTVLNLGFQLLYSKPYSPLVNACGGINRNFDKDQQVFEVKDNQSDQLVKIGIPCKEYPEAYLISYTPLAKTWIVPKQKMK